MPDGFRLPQSDEHTFIVGQNGSGKTQLGTWLLSESDFDKRPHVILDFKRDDLINKIKRAEHLNPKDRPPKEAGIYIRRCTINDPLLEKFLEDVWKNNKTHLHIDETYMIDPRSDAFNAILTQGRSKQISTACLSQRPAYCSRFIPSEAANIVVFRLNDKRDRDTVKGFYPPEIDLRQKLLPYHSHWYAAKRDFYTLLQPVPDSVNILERFEERLKPKHNFI